ncbi:MAG: DNA-processing protein DprA [Brevinematia bacterium]
MTREEILFLNYLNVGFKRYSYIKENFGSILNSPKDEQMAKYLRIKYETLKEISYGFIEKKVNELEKLLKTFGIGYITVEDKDYPKRLRGISEMPIIIYYKGNKELLNDSTSCGIVGTRRNDELGKNYTKNIVDILTKNNVVIVSGLARGIDIIAHRKTLENNGKAVAVLGSGLDYIYPPEHKKEFFEIAEKGCLVSEFLPKTPALKRNFFIRNRIISGLSDVIVIIQAPENSGALITGEYALKQNKTLFAIPGNIENPLHKGCNIMIKKGAKPLIEYKDILEELGYKTLKNELFYQRQPTQLSEEEKFVYSLINKEITLDDLSEISGMSVSQIYPIILSLEIKGLIIQNTGGTFSRIAV